MLLWLVVPIGMGVASILLYNIVGISDSAEMMAYINSGQDVPTKYKTPIYKAHFLVETVLFYLFIMLQVIFVAVATLRLLINEGLTWRVVVNFLMGRDSCPRNMVVVGMLLVVIFVMGVRCGLSMIYYSNLWIGIIISLIYTGLCMVMCNVTLGTADEEITIGDLFRWYVTVYPNEPINRSAAYDKSAQDMPSGEYASLEVPSDVGAINASGVHMTADEYLRLLNDFNRVVIDERAYLKEDLTLSSLVEVLGVNRSYISYLVNREYRMSFRDVVGKLRIDDAVKYMKEDPACKQEVLAAKCGFSSASAFNRRFTQIVGMTPRLWQMRNINNETQKQ